MKNSSIPRRLESLQQAEGCHLLPEGLPDFPKFSNPLETFRAELREVGSEFLDGRQDLASALQRVLDETQTTTFCWEQLNVLERACLPYTAPVASGLERDSLLLSRHPSGRLLPIEVKTVPRTLELLASLEVSVSLARAAIAETGTVVESTAEQGSRVLPILAGIHVSLVSVRTLFQSSAELFAQPLRGSAQIMMTGPSRTADIEKTLIIGVHGPKRLFVILLP